MSTISKDIIVSIDSDLSLTIERKFYEYQAGQDNIAFLMKDKNINWDILQYYINVVETRYVELELLKQEISQKYCPKIMKNLAYNYEFLFDSFEIKYSLSEV